MIKGSKTFILPLLWAGFIAVLTLIPGSALRSPKLLTFSHADKIVHLIFYTILAYLLLRATKKSKTPPKTKNMILVLVITYGIALEYAQKYTNMSRSFENLDIIANIGGVFVGMLIFKFFNKPFLS